jgi:ribosomal protein S18 acetylase RimI-like enzyme
MHWNRFWQSHDLPFATQAVAAGSWESLSPEERAASTPEQVAQIAAQQLREVLGSPMGLGLVAMYGHFPIGFLLGAVSPDSTTDETNGHVMMIWVTPACRRRGVARHLYNVAEGCFERAGVRKVKLWTGLHNQAAVALARSAGYQPEGLIGMKAL